MSNLVSYRLEQQVVLHLLSLVFIKGSDERDLSLEARLRVCPRVAVKTACCLRQDYSMMKYCHVYQTNLVCLVIFLSLIKFII